MKESNQKISEKLQIKQKKSSQKFKKFSYFEGVFEVGSGKKFGSGSGKILVPVNPYLPTLLFTYMLLSK